MAGVPITNSFGEVAYGAAVPVDAPDYTRDILAGMRQKQAQEDEAIKEAMRQKRAREEKLNKHRNDLGKWQLTQEKGIWKGRTPELKALAQDMFTAMQDGLRESPNTYDPDTDKRLFEAEQNFQRATDEWQQENKLIQAHMATAMDPKKRDAFNVNDEFLDAYQAGDPEKLRRAIAKNALHDENRAGEINTYSGVGFLNPVDTTDWHSQTVKAAKSLNVPIREVDMGDGKYRKTQQLSPEEKEKAYEAWSMGAGAKLKRSMISQAQANNPFFPEEKADEILKPLFLANIEDNVNLKGGQPRMTEGQKNEEKLFFSPYTTKGAEGGAPGFNVGFIGGNKGLKADLQYGTNVLKDVDLKTVYKGKDGDLKAIVMQYDYEQRPLTEDEIVKEKQNAAAQMREPVLTKTVRTEKPKEIDFSVGSNNYNTIVAQYPGVEGKVNELISSKSQVQNSKSKGAAKEVTQAKIKALVGTKGYEGYSEKELVDYYKSQGYTIK